MAMEQSILNSTKKNLSVDPDYHIFDLDIMTHINAAFFSLNQLGIGPANGFSIEDDVSIWLEFVPDGPDLHAIKSYIYLKVKVLFDSPTAWHLVAAMEKQITEFEWRLGVDREGKSWVNPNPPRSPLTIIEDGIAQTTADGSQVVVI